MERRTRVVILGGGFGGLYVALELEKTLARDPNAEITLINRENFFLFTPMLHEVAASDLDREEAARRAGLVARPLVLQGPGAIPHLPRSQRVRGRRR